jgi:hypothetical protein
MIWQREGLGGHYSDLQQDTAPSTQHLLLLVPVQRSTHFCCLRMASWKSCSCAVSCSDLSASTLSLISLSLRLLMRGLNVHSLVSACRQCGRGAGHECLPRVVNTRCAAGVVNTRCAAGATHSTLLLLLLLLLPGSVCC